MRRPAPALLVDVLLVLAFAAIGRRSHDEGLTAAGVAQTAWPFLAGLAAGWAVLAVAGRTNNASTVSSGAVVWAATVAGGMALRALTGQGTALAFVVVATVFTGVTLVGWRAAARAIQPGPSSTFTPAHRKPRKTPGNHVQN